MCLNSYSASINVVKKKQKFLISFPHFLQAERAPHVASLKIESHARVATCTAAARWLAS